jgi:hypothetical protein
MRIAYPKVAYPIHVVRNPQNINEIAPAVLAELDNLRLFRKIYIPNAANKGWSKTKRLQAFKKFNGRKNSIFSGKRGAD